MLTSLAAGLGLGFSLIIAIGAQNLFVLRQGLRREHVLAVATICAVSDAILIALGVSGVGLVLQAAPWLIGVVRWAGALFLVGYGLLAARRAWRPSGATLDGSADAETTAASTRPGAGPTPPEAPRDGPAAPGVAVGTAFRASGTTAQPRLASVLLTCLALTWLNPHVYLDTVFLLGTVASTHGDERWIFAAGAMAASVVWFFSLGFGARLLGRRLSTPRAWRILDAVIAVVMIALGVSLVLPAVG